MKKAVTSHGGRIRGDLTPFYCDNIKKAFSEAIVKGSVEDIIQDLRLLIKEAVYLRYKVALTDCGKNFLMTQSTERIINDFLDGREDHPKTKSFVRCVNAYFTGQETADNIVLKDIKCHSKSIYKSLKHAEKDCEKVVSAMINPILNNIILNQDQYSFELLERYRDIEDAINFINYYFKSYFYGIMPKIIDSVVYIEASELDMKVAEHYVYNSELEKYNILSDRNNKFSTINQESATYIICRCWC